MKALVVMVVMGAAVLGWPAPGDVVSPSTDIYQRNWDPHAVTRYPLYNVTRSIWQVSRVYPVIPYEFAYEVSDPETGNFQNRVEVKLANGDVFGSWSVLLPSRVILTVVYNVTDNQGFRYTLTMVPVTSHDL